MARPPKPWFRKSRNTWFVTIDGVLHNLGPDEEEAQRQFHALMARKPEERTPEPDALLVAEVCDRFLGFCEKNRSPKTYRWYKEFIQGFLNHLPNAATLSVDGLKPIHVVNWCDESEGWTANTRRGAIIAICRAFNWAEKMGLVERSPIRNVEKPRAEPREEFMSQEQWEQIRDHYKEGDKFRLLLTFLWETGCRPFEARQLEAKHVNLDKMVCVIPRKQSKNKRKPRIIHLNPKAAAILKMQITAYPEGAVFRNRAGRPWTAYAMNCRFCRLKKHFDDTKFCSYLFRHGFANKKLTQGHDHLTVAEIMGHANGSMLASVYSHLGDSHDHLKKVVNSD